MAVIAQPPTQTHADVTRDVVATLEPASRGYYMMLFGAVGLFLVGIGTFILILQGRPGAGRLQPADLLVGLHHHVRVLGRHRPRRAR